MRRFTGIVAAGFLLLSSGVATAAPVQTSVSLVLAIQGLAPITITDSGTVDVSGDTITVPAGLVQLGTTITVPVTGATSVNMLTVTKLTNLGGTFSLNGVTNQYAAEVCPVGPNPGLGEACNAGGGIGGIMGLTGTIIVKAIPGGLTIPINLNFNRIGQGGVGNAGFTTEAALWTTGTGAVNTIDPTLMTGNIVTLQGTNNAPSPGISLVTPTFVSVFNNLLPVFGTLILPDVTAPEPQGLLLIGSGLAALAVLRRKRRR